MMRRTATAFSLVLLLACSGPTEKAAPPPPPPPPKYAFYPKANVYFDTVNKVYSFLGGDGRTWTTGAEIPLAMRSMMDKSVLLDTFASPVWKDNENHRLVYAAALYAAPEDTVAEKAPPAPSQSVEGKKEEPKKERKGLRRFFDKVFGRGKKDKEG